MRPDQCGTGGVPADHPDRAAVDRFRDFLADIWRMNKGQLTANEFRDRWAAYIDGDTGWVRCPECPNPGQPCSCSGAPQP